MHLYAQYASGSPLCQQSFWRRESCRAQLPILTIPILPGERLSNLHLIGKPPHLLADSTVDTIGSNQKIAFERLPVGSDDFHPALQSVDRLDLRRRNYFVFVLEVFVKRGKEHLSVNEDGRESVS